MKSSIEKVFQVTMKNFKRATQQGSLLWEFSRSRLKFFQAGLKFSSETEVFIPEAASRTSKRASLGVHQRAHKADQETH